MKLLSHELVHRYGGMTQAFETAIYPEFKEFDFSTKEKEIAPGLADQPQVLHSTKYDREMGREFTNCSPNSYFVRRDSTQLPDDFWHRIKDDNLSTCYSLYC